jgi:hypothetical protein
MLAPPWPAYGGHGGAITVQHVMGGTVTHLLRLVTCHRGARTQNDATARQAEHAESATRMTRLGARERPAAPDPSDLFAIDGLESSELVERT